MIELLNCDCMEYMEGLEDNAFDLAIVDPPYGIGDFSMDGKEKNAHRGTYDWNNKPPEDKYFSELKRTSKNRIIWGANYYNCFDKSGGAIIWYKRMGHPCLSDCEIASCSMKKIVKYIHIDWQSGFARSKSGGTFHPCQKPVSLYDWLLKNYAKEGDRILDTHLGSGSSAIAAHYGGFDFVGMEIDKDYYGAAVKRFNSETAQVDMFAAP
ncbi:MAG: site-specific DNA-methyltransferase [Planctomycetaceae bacterium]|nr:site-specific DNA-methyltransferase [Planctomycetaceae bacterium]